MPGLGLGKLSLDLRHIDSVVAAGRKKDSVAEKRELTEVESHQVLVCTDASLMKAMRRVQLGERVPHQFFLKPET